MNEPRREVTARRTTVGSVVRDRGIVALLVGESISMTGSRMSALALPWFVLTTTGSAKQMSLVVASEVTAYAIFGLPSGLILARIGARRAMLACDLMRTPLMMLVPVLFWLDMLHLSELVGIAFLAGALSTPYGPAQRMLMAELLDDDSARVGQANALFQGAQRTTVVLGPSLAGLLIGFIGAPRVLVIDAATFGLSFLLIASLVPRHPIVKEPEATTPRLFDGIRYLRKDTFLARLIGAVVLLDGVSEALWLAIPVLVFVEYSANVRLAGAFIASWGAGAIVGNIVSYRKLKQGASDRAMALLFAVGALPLVFLALAVPAYVIALAMLVSGLANGLSNPTFHSLITLRPPAVVRANVLSVFFTASSVLAPVAVVGAGAAFKPIGPRAVLGIAAGVEIAVGFFVAHAFLAVSRLGGREERMSTRPTE